MVIRVGFAVEIDWELFFRAALLDHEFILFGSVVCLGVYLGAAGLAVPEEV
jgi:hypothetical protein